MPQAGPSSYIQVTTPENTVCSITVPAPGPGFSNRIVAIYADTSKALVVSAMATLKESTVVRDTISLPSGHQYQVSKMYRSPLKGAENVAWTFELPALGTGIAGGLTVDYFVE